MRQGKTGLTSSQLVTIQVRQSSDIYGLPLHRLQQEAAKRKKNVTDKPFKTAHVLPKSSTPGDFFGTSGKVPYMPVREIAGDGCAWWSCGGSMQADAAG
jgi:hypothetical protein